MQYDDEEIREPAFTALALPVKPEPDNQPAAIENTGPT